MVLQDKDHLHLSFLWAAEVAEVVVQQGARAFACIGKFECTTTT